MTTIGTLYVKLAADTGALVAGMNRAEASVQRFAQNARALLNVGLIAGVATGIAQFVRQIEDAAKENLKWANGLEASARQIGVTTKWLQEFGFVAEQAGVGQEALAKALEKAQENLAKFAAGSGDKVLTQFGLSVRNAKGEFESLDVLLPKIADRIKLFDRPSRLAIADTIFGKGAEEMLPILEKGGAEMRRMIARARELGVAVDDGMVQKAAAYHRKLAELEAGPMARIKEATLALSIGWVDALAGATRLTDHLATEMLPILRVLPGIGPTLQLWEAQREAQNQAEADARPTGEMRSILPGNPFKPKPKPAGTRKINLGGENPDIKFLDDLSREVEELEMLAEAAAKGGRALQDMERAQFVMAQTQKLSIAATAEEWQQTAKLAGQRYDANRLLTETRRILDEIRTPQEDYLERTQLLSELLAKGAINQDQFTRAMLLARARMLENNELFQGAVRLIDRMGESVVDFAFSSGDAMQSFRNVAVSALRDVANEIFKLGVVNPLKNALYGGQKFDTFGSLFAGTGAGFGNDVKEAGGLGSFFGSLFGFATGGSFEVGGPGGTDRTPIGFMATRGERVTVETPEQQRRGRGGGVTIYQDFRNVSGSSEVRRVVSEALAQAAPMIVGQAEMRVRDGAARNPRYFQR